MFEIKFAVATFTVIGVAVVVGVIIRAIGLSEFIVRFKFRNDNTNAKQLKK